MNIRAFLARRSAQRADRNAARLAAQLAGHLAQTHRHLGDRLAATVAEEVHRNVAHVHAHLVAQLSAELGRQMGDTRQELHQAVAHLHAHLVEHLGAELARQMGDVRHDLQQAIAHLHAHLDAHLAEQLGAGLARQMGDVRHDLHQAVAHLHAHLDAHLAEQLGAEIARQMGDVRHDLQQADHAAHQSFAHIHAWLAETLARNHAGVLGDLHKHIGHVDAHLSEHLTKQIALHVGAGATAAHRDKPQILQQRVLSLGRYLTPVAAEGVRKVRLGHWADGGYILLDDFARVGFALSFGVGPEMTWDLAIAERGIDVHQFDHTVEQPPATHPRVHFHRRRIAAVRQGADETLRSAQQLGGDSPCIVKMDIEGDEWRVLEAAAAGDFRQVTQFVCEFHDFDRVGDAAWYTRASAVLAALAESFCVVHVHGNNNAPFQSLGNVAFPEILEVTFANRAFYTFAETREIFPTALDAPNRQDLPDIFLGSFRF